MSQRVERQFPAEFVRQGGLLTKTLVTIQCCRCPNTKVHESKTVLPDEVISKRLKRWGWVLGRNRSYDICPSCAGVTVENRLAGRFRVTSDGSQVASPSEVADAVGRDRARKAKETEALIDRTFGRNPSQASIPEASPSEPMSSEPQTPVTPESRRLETIEQSVVSMAGEIGQMRAGIELLLEQIGTLVGLQGQQVQAIANLSGIVARSNEGIGVGLNMLSAAVRELSQNTKAPGPVPASPHPVSDIDIPSLPLRSRDPAPGKQKADSRNLPSPSRTRLHSRTKADHRPVSINSYRDGKNPSKYYTMVQLPKSAWTDFGFHADDRVLIDRVEDQSIHIRRAEEGGVKLKKVTDATITIQTTRIGNLNFEVQNPVGSNGELLLHA